MKKHHSSPRNLRRAAERKARKQAAKAQKHAAELAKLVQSPSAAGSALPLSCPVVDEARQTLKLDAELEKAAEVQNIEVKTMAAGVTAMANWKDLLEGDLEFQKSLNRNDNSDDDNNSETPTENLKERPISDARLNANRANAQHSTGPRTKAGRIASSQNRRIHGLTPGCSFVILEGEDSGAYQKLRQNLLDEHKPETQSEITVVEDMAQHIWLRQRGRNFQNEALDENTGKVVDAKLYFLYERYCVSHDQAFHRCFSTLSRIRKERELLRLGSERKQLVEMKAEIRERVQRDIQNCRQTGDWTGFGDRMFAFREEIAQKYRPKA